MIIPGGYYYVDKTGLAQRLIAEGKYYFLPRPRRHPVLRISFGGAHHPYCVNSGDISSQIKLESNHSARFWNIVRAKVPLAEKGRQWLKAHGQLLQEEI